MSLSQLEEMEELEEEEKKEEMEEEEEMISRSGDLVTDNAADTFPY